LQATDTTRLAEVFARLLKADISTDVASAALIILKDQFGDPRAAGSQMAARAVGLLMSADEVAQSCSVLASNLLRVLPGGNRG